MFSFMDPVVLRTTHHDDAIREAALHQISTVGVDRLTLPAVAACAGLTVRAVERAYPTTAELLVGLWATHGRSAIVAMFERTVRALGPAATPEQAVRSRADIEAPPAELFAAVEMCMVAHRVGELGDVVPQDVRRSLVDLGVLDEAGGACDMIATAAVAAMTLGVVRRRGLGEELFDPARVLPRLRTLMVPPPRPIPEAHLPWDDRGLGEDASSQLIRAARRVVSRGGVARATATRIRRLAAVEEGSGRSTIVVADAAVDGLATHIGRTMADPANIAARVGDGSFLAACKEFLGPAQRPRGRMVLELLLGLCHGGPDSMRDVQLVLFDGLADRFAAASGSRAHSRQMAAFLYTTVDGLVLLDDMVGSVAQLDWCPFVRAVMRLPPESTDLEAAEVHGRAG